MYYFDTETMTPTSISRDKSSSATSTYDEDNTSQPVEMQHDDTYTSAEIKSTIRAHTMIQLLSGISDTKLTSHIINKNHMPGIQTISTVDKLTKDSLHHYSFLSTVNSNKEYFTKQEIERVDESRRLQAITAYPSGDKFRSILKNNLITNCKVTIPAFHRPVLWSESRILVVEISSVKMTVT